MLPFLGFVLVSLVGADPQGHYNVFLQHETPSSFGQGFDFNTIQQSPAFGTPSGYFGATQAPPAATTVDPITLGCGTPPASCPKTRYRSYDGSCNNLKNPVLGTPQTPYVRLLPAVYGDGLSTPTESKTGKPLPPSRVVSLLLYPDVPLEDPKWTLNAMQYGQIITHDMSMIAGSTQAQPHQTRCCTDDGQLLELANIPEHCYPILVPQDDPAHAQTNTKCMNFVRTITTRDRRCVSDYEPAEQLTVVNHFLDLSIVYGNNNDVNRQVREFRGGRLRVDVRRGKEWLPRAANATASCSIQSPQEACYFAGDTRVNQNPQLTLLQTILMREHNRIADVLSKLNPHWDDEIIFQEARKIAIAEHQHISYYEWLPIFIGADNSLKNKILFNTKNYVDDYSEHVDPTIINEHATAAFRYFHSAIAGHLDLVTEHRSSYGNVRLSDWLLRPAILEEEDNFDDLTRGLATQPELNVDQYHDNEITQYLFRGDRPFGADLKAIDIQRNRDHGLASYNDMRHFCGLPKAHTFDDFTDVISKENVQKLAALYPDPDDVDLTVGGSLEAHVPGTLAGPTFLCILTEQFFRTRAGDRFWYEHSEHNNGFTLSQLNAIRKVSISRLLCDNGHHIEAMQPRGFERISHSNGVVPCESLPSVDLSLWKDLGGGHQLGHGFESYNFKK
ncbi:PREDICTED: peroxidase [Nicrophorus vespilloides]|uniref:Peroxidase n=1 Tax=Nicrophorus vespilloides TaxID=110193 RepID=A0ABM1NGE5_NICVS|nr:PREDICTED: peroxidase [Nicrophorus vespilloides]